MNLQKEILSSANKQRGLLTAAKIARRLGTDPKTISRTLDRLERKGKIQQITWEKILLQGK